MRRTRASIIEAFAQLLEERPINKITVKDIVNRCDINRNTFYYHFPDIPSLLLEMMEEKVNALIEVKVTPQRGMGFDKIAERIYQYSEVNSVYLMSGAFDFTVIIEGKTMREVAQFVSEKLSPMDSVLSTATHFVLKKYKDHGTIMYEKPGDERMMITP